MGTGRSLSRGYEHRKALMRNLATALFKEGSIVTTLAKAKETRPYVEDLITKAKTLEKERATQLISGKIFEPKVVFPILFNELAKRYADRPGGYTRIIKLEPRLGDNAEQCVIELVDHDYEIKFWYLARIVARLELQGEELNFYTKENVRKLIQLRKNGEDTFRDAVDECKEVFYNKGEGLDALRPANRPHDIVKTSKKFEFVPRPKKTVEAET